MVRRRNAEDSTEGVAVDALGNLWMVDSEGFVKESDSPIPACSGNGGGFTYEIEDRGGDIAIDGDDNAWIISGPNGEGNLSEFSNSGTPISPSKGFVGVPYEPVTLNGYASIRFADLAPDSSGNLWVIQELYTGDYSQQTPYTYYAKEFIGLSARRDPALGRSQEPFARFQTMTVTEAHYQTDGVSL